MNAAENKLKSFFDTLKVPLKRSSSYVLYTISHQPLFLRNLLHERWRLFVMLCPDININAANKITLTAI